MTFKVKSPSVCVCELNCLDIFHVCVTITVKLWRRPSSEAPVQLRHLRQVSCVRLDLELYALELLHASYCETDECSYCFSCAPRQLRCSTVHYVYIEDSVYLWTVTGSFEISMWCMCCRLIILQLTCFSFRFCPTWGSVVVDKVRLDEIRIV